MASLNTYLKETQRLVHDSRQELIDPSTLISFINIARREVAMRAQCCRVFTNSSGACVAITVTAPGTGYTSVPTVTISAPDFPSGKQPYPNGAQATASAIISVGEVANAFVEYGGSGYFQPTVTFSGGGGSGAAGTVSISPINVLNQAQEVYPFSDIDLTGVPGAKSVYFVRGLSVIFSNYRYSLPCYSFSEYQARIRQYPFQYQDVPAFSSQFGQGSDGSFYIYPLPSQTYQFELDCLALPQDLTTDLSVELIPDPWTQAVKFYALHLAYLSLQNFNAANYYETLFDKQMPRYGQYARIGRAINPYGRP